MTSNNNEYMKKYYREHSDEKKAYQRKYQQEHAGEIREYGKKYREMNTERIKERKKKYQQENREKIREQKRRHSQECNERRFGVQIPENPVCMYGGELLLEKVCFDHDHNCKYCNGEGCLKCFRGFTCTFHNRIEGFISKVSTDVLNRILRNTGRFCK